MWLPMVLLLNHNIPTLLELDHAKRTEVVSGLVAKDLLVDAMDCKVLFKICQFQSLLMPINGVHIVQEFSQTVDLLLIMLSFLLVLLVETGKLKTLGELAGEKEDTSD